VNACPYCGADSAGNPVIRFLRYGSLLLALGGLCFLYFMSASREPAPTRVGDITPMMNFAHVRLDGTVERDAYIGRRNGRPDYLSFMIDDGTGRARVVAYDRTARTLIDEGRVPKTGQRLTVAGTLNVSADGLPRLRLVSAAQLEAGSDQTADDE